MRGSALILAGGSGTRFWPASRRDRPKQLLTLEGERSLLQTTVDRLAPLVPAERVWISTTEALAPAIAEQLPEVAPERILIEPVGRNTAPAIAWSVRRLPVEVQAEPLAVLAADHRVADPAAFRETLGAAFEVAGSGEQIVALGVVPRYPEIGFGYLELGEGLPGPAGLRRVVRFREKPDFETAQSFVASGRHLWNASMFVFRGDLFLAELGRHAPELAAGLERLAAQPERAAELYAALPSISVDFALMERLDELATLPLDCGWDDVGSWSALFDVLAGDADGNRVRGEGWTIGGRGNLVFSEEGPVALVGVDDLVVVRSGGAVLVLRRQEAQRVKELVDRLAADGRSDLL